MNYDLSPTAKKRGKMLWGGGPLPQGSLLLGTIRRGEDQGEEALILLPTGVTVGGNEGVVRFLRLELFCLRCEHHWGIRGAELPRICPRCKTAYWDRPKRVLG